MELETLLQSATQLLDNCGGGLTNCAMLVNPNSFPSPEMMCGRMLQGQFAWLGRLFPVFIVLILWEAVWKILALRKAGRNNQLWRFLCILIFNTIGILPILYLSFFQKKDHGNN